jgi:uncharacterized OB-fold protein
MAEYRHTPTPVPNPIPTSQPFWAATKEHKFMLQRCPQGHVFYYARTHCPECLSRDLEWFEASGKGKLYSYTVCRRAQSPDFEPDVPYVVAAIVLDEGPRMTSLLVDADPDNVQVDGRVEVVWQDVSEEVSMPYFRPVG